MGVKVPRVTLNADFGEENAFGELSLISLGLGIHQSWVYATMFGDSSVFGVDNFIAFSSTTSVSFPYVVSICVYIVALLFMALTGRPRTAILSPRKEAAAACACASIGTLLLTFAASAPLWPLQLLSGVLTGIGSSLLIILWGSAYARCGSSSIVLNTAVAVSVAIFIYTIVLHCVPTPASGVLAACMPALELPILLKKTPEAFLLDGGARDGGAGGQGDQDARNGGNAEFMRPAASACARFIARFSAPVLVFGIALGILRQNSLQGIVPAAGVYEQLLMVLAAGIATVILMITIVAIADSGQWTTLFRALVPFIAVTVFFVPLAESENWMLADVFLLVGFLCFEALMWIFFSEVSHRCKLSPVLVFGIGRGVLALAILIGSFLPITKSNFTALMPFGENGLVVIILFVLVIAYSLLPRRNEIDAIVGNADAAAVAEADDADGAGAGAGAGDANVANGADAAGDADGAGATGGVSGAGAVSEAGRAGMVSETAAASTAAASEPAGEGANETDAGEGAGETGADVHGEADAVAPEAAGAGEKDERDGGKRDGGDKPRGGGRFRRKCDAVSATYMLSQRESEVLFLLAKGYNAASLQSRLYISEGTAKTHIRHIYRKLDVHSQQELIRIIESTDDPEGWDEQRG